MVGTSQYPNAVMDSKISPGAFSIPGAAPGKQSAQSLQIKLSGGDPASGHASSTGTGPAVARRASRGVAAKAGEFSVRVYNMIEECHDKTPEIATWIMSEDVPDESQAVGVPHRSAVARGGFLVHDANGLVTTYFEAYEFVNRNTSQPTTFISFQRQLNNYGFSVRSPDGNVKVVRHEMDLFQRGRLDLVKLIKKNQNSSPHIAVHTGVATGGTVATNTSPSGEGEAIVTGGSSNGGPGSGTGVGVTEKRANAATIQYSITELRTAMVRQTNQILLKLGAEESELLPQKIRGHVNGSIGGNSGVSRGVGSAGSVGSSIIGASSVGSSCLALASTGSDNRHRGRPNTVVAGGSDSKKTDVDGRTGGLVGVEVGAMAVEETVPATTTPSPSPNFPVPATPPSPPNHVDNAFTGRVTDKVPASAAKKSDGAEVSPSSSPVKKVTGYGEAPSHEPSPMAENSPAQGNLHEQNHQYPRAATMPAVQETDFDDEASDDFYVEIANIFSPNEEDMSVDDEVEFGDFNGEMDKKENEKNRKRSDLGSRKDSPANVKKNRTSHPLRTEKIPVSKSRVSVQPLTPHMEIGVVDEEDAFDTEPMEDYRAGKITKVAHRNAKVWSGLKNYHFLVLVLLVLVALLQVVAIAMAGALLSRYKAGPGNGVANLGLPATREFSGCVEFEKLGAFEVTHDVVAVSLSSNGTFVAALTRTHVQVWSYQENGWTAVHKLELKHKEEEEGAMAYGVDIALSGDASTLAVVSRVASSPEGFVQTFIVPPRRLLQHLQPFWNTSVEGILAEGRSLVDESTRNYVSLSETGEYLLVAKSSEKSGANLYAKADSGFYDFGNADEIGLNSMVSVSLPRDESKVLWTLAGVPPPSPDGRFVRMQFEEEFDVTTISNPVDCPVASPLSFVWNQRTGVAVSGNGVVAAVGCGSADFGTAVDLYMQDVDGAVVHCGWIAPPPQEGHDGAYERIGFPGSISVSSDGSIVALESQSSHGGLGGYGRRRVLLFQRTFELSECSRDSRWEMISDGLEQEMESDDPRLQGGGGPVGLSVASLSTSGDVLATVDANGHLRVRRVLTDSCPSK